MIHAPARSGLRSATSAKIGSRKPGRSNPCLAGTPCFGWWRIFSTGVPSTASMIRSGHSTSRSCARGRSWAGILTPARRFVSLLLESAHAGGDFEFIPRFEGSAEHIRRQVSNVLEGDWSESVEVAMSPGDFVLFCGRHSLHRVTTIAGSGERLMLLMSFDNAAHRDDNVGNVNLFGPAKRLAAKPPFAASYQIVTRDRPVLPRVAHPMRT